MTPEQLKQQIEQEAKMYADLQRGDKAKFNDWEQWTEWNDTNADYIACATAYATRAITAEQENERLKELLDEWRLQIEYLHNKFGETGTGNNVLARIEALTTKPSEDVETG